METFTSRAPHDGARTSTRRSPRSRPDALLVDCMSWGAAAVAERLGRAVGAVVPLSAAGVVARRAAVRPGPARRRSGPAGRLRDRVLRPLLTGTMEKASLPELNATREKLGVRPVESADELFLAAPLLLYMTAEPLEYPRSDWPAVGADGRPVLLGSARGPAGLARRDREAHRPRQHLVRVPGRREAGDDGARGARDEDVQVVATLPSADMPASVPANARVEPFVPHAPILERAACAITHGGAGVTMKALAAGVPVCVVPVRPRSARGRPPRRDRGRGHAGGALEAQRGAPARRRAPSDDDEGRARRESPQGSRRPAGRPPAADAFEAVAADRKRVPIGSR